MNARKRKDNPNQLSLFDNRVDYSPVEPKRTDTSNDKPPVSKKTPQLVLPQLEMQLPSGAEITPKVPIGKKSPLLTDSDPDPALSQQDYQRFVESFCAAAGGPWSIFFHDNVRTMISFNRKQRSVRLHHIFGKAPKELIKDIALRVNGRMDRWSTSVGKFIRDNQDSIRTPDKPVRKLKLTAKGKVYDLQSLFDQLNKVYFGASLSNPVGWGKPPIRRGRRHNIRLGSWSEASNAIRIHPTLDRKQVPSYVIETVLYHEMCHAAIGTDQSEGRRIVHGKEFYAILNRHPKVKLADQWIEKNITMLLRWRQA